MQVQNNSFDKIKNVRGQERQSGRTPWRAASLCAERKALWRVATLCMKR